MENKLFIVDDEGKEIQMNIYFTFDMNDNQYVVVYEQDHEDVLYSFRYDEDGNLYPVDDEDELAMIEEVIGAYEEEN